MAYHLGNTCRLVRWAAATFVLPVCESQTIICSKKARGLCIHSPVLEDLIWFCVHQTFGSITIILLSPYLCPRAIQTWTRRMWTASNFLFERLWILVLRTPTAHRNNANTRAEQFVFYLQVHLRLCTGHLNHSLFISSSADLLRNACKLTLSPVLGGGK